MVESIIEKNNRSTIYYPGEDIPRELWAKNPWGKGKVPFKINKKKLRLRIEKAIEEDLK